MNKQVPLITKVQYFETSYEPIKANVSARNFSSVTYRKSGKVFFLSNENQFISEEGTLTFMPAGCNYSTEILTGGEMFVLHYQVAEGSSDIFDKPTLIRPVYKNKIIDVFIEALSHSIIGNEFACMADAYKIFSEIYKEIYLREMKPPKNLALVKQFIDQNYTLSELRISTLAKLYKTSETYFRREFKKYYGESPIEYIKRRRIEMACHLLRTELYTITDVASRSGFESISYFSLEFKRYVGCSPSAYRNL
jgi:AraC-like DNA-binding protein